MIGARATQQLSALAEVGALLDGAGFDYWLFGGWGVDFHVGAVTREHDDVDLAVWLDEAEAIGALLEAERWRHAPTGEEDGGIGYERGGVRVELTFLTSDDGGRVFLPLRDRTVLWSEEPMGDEERELLGVRSRVLPLALLTRGKSTARYDLDDAAKDRADYEALSKLTHTTKMHADEVDTDPSLVRRLVAAQFPQWAVLPIEPVPSGGTDNVLFRLGDDMVVRLPRHERTNGTLEKEREWLPRLAPLLPLAVPVPLADGMPGEGYPFEWAVYRWLEGENATPERVTDQSRLATDLARFVAALQRIDPTGGPPPGEHNVFRGEPLARRDEPTRAAITSLGGAIDVDVVTSAWEAALRAPEWERPPVWIHGDLDSRNLLAEDGRLGAVIDFGCLGVGDPACDVAVVWKMLSADTRDVFRAELSVDEATWSRSRGWALSQALIALPYYTLETNAVLVREAERWLAEVLGDHAPSR